MLLMHKRFGDYEILEKRPLDERVSIDVTPWPAFGTFGFAQSGSILLDSLDYQTSIIVSSVGRIRQIKVLKK